MARDLRQKDINWSVPANDNGGYSWDAAHMAVLLDLRDELAEIRRRLHPLTCVNFMEIPTVLNAIKNNTRRRTKRTKKAK